MGDSSESSTRGSDGDGADGETSTGSLAQKPYKIKKRLAQAARTPSPTAKDDMRASRERSEGSSLRQHTGTHPPRSLGMGVSSDGPPLAAPLSYPTATSPWPSHELPMQIQTHQHQQQIFMQQQYQMQQQLQQQMQIQLGQQMHMQSTLPSCGGYPPLGGYPPQQEGTHTTSSPPSAPLLWRGGEGQRSPPFRSEFESM